MKDPCIRELLKETELKHYFDDFDSKVVEELNLPVAKARIDIAVINGSLHGYEIKSAADTLKRLPSQIEAYTKVFDYLSIVTEGKYGTKILDFVPEWIGVILCQENKGIKTITELRKPTKNVSKEGIYIAKLLWREELIECLNQYNLKFRKKDRNWLLCEVLSTNLEIDLLSTIVREKLKARNNWKGEHRN
jgi:hypothetical protein